MTEDRKTFIILTPGFAESETDTTCLPFLQNFVENVNLFYPALEIIIIAFQYPYYIGTYFWKNNQVISFDGRDRGRWNRLKVWMQVWRTLKQLKRQKKVLGLFSLWCTECALVGKYFGKLFQIRHITWLCGQDAKTNNKYVKLVNPNAKDLIAMSDFLKREFYKNHHVEPGHVIPIGVDPLQFPVEPLNRTVDILGVGSLIPLKQYDVYIEVVNEINNLKPGIHSVILGKGPEEQKLKTMINDRNLRDTVLMVGEIPHSETLNLMQRAKVFLHTSEFEGFGTVCLEALYAGAHVVSFTKPMDILIKHWYHVNNKDEMIQVILKLLGDTQITYQSILPFSEETIVREIIGLYL